MRLLPWLLLSALAISFAAHGQDDDDLAPIAPKKPKAPPAAKARPRPKAPPPAPKAKPDEDDDLAPIAATKADLTIKFGQGLSNAIVSIDGKDVGPLPVPPQSLAAGEHTVKVRRIGYGDFVKRVTIVGGKAQELEAKLTPINAVVSVTSDVADAQVFVNGRLVGSAPITELELPAGSTEIAVRKEGFKDDKQRLTLVAGKDYPIVVKFNPGTVSTVVAAVDRPVEPRLTPTDGDTSTNVVTTTAEETPVTQRWWFWAGIGAVVAAGVVTGVVLATNGNQPPLRLTADQLCGPNGCDSCIGGPMCMPNPSAGVLSF